MGNNKIVQLIDNCTINLPELSEQDYLDIDLAIELECDFLIISHVKNWQTIATVKEYIKKLSPRPICLLGKISSNQGVENFDDILRVADGIVVDRESLQVDIRSEKLLLAQKSMIAKCNRVSVYILSK